MFVLVNNARITRFSKYACILILSSVVTFVYEDIVTEDDYFLGLKAGITTETKVHLLGNRSQISAATDDTK